ncbi:MAG: AcvB/VirJ family lysyl-phosphatidylglycerol hydrolase [Rhodospirillaceae bacterium]
MRSHRSFLYAAISTAAWLAGCDDSRLHEARLQISDEVAARLTWVQPGAERLVILFGSSEPANARAVARTLAWPDRAVLTLSPPQSGTAPPRCTELVNAAARRLADLRRKKGHPEPEAPIVVAMNEAGSSGLALAGTPQTTGLSAAVVYEHCPGEPPPATPFCTADVDLPAEPSSLPVVVITDKSRCAEADVLPAVRHFADARVIAADGGNRIDLLSTTVDQVLGHVGGPTPTADTGLPVVPLPAAGDGKQLAIFFSGDGGWADIDSDIGEELSRRGVAVVGFDTLKYFWRKQDPAAAAADLARVIAQYSAAWKRDDIVLIGYSFGADVLPFLWQNLDPASRAKVSNVIFLGLGDAASMEITVGGWVGVTPAQALPTVPAARSISAAHMMCFYGVDEGSKACPALAAYGAEVFAMPGGHHFDGAYEKVADLILKRITK